MGNETIVPSSKMGLTMPPFAESKPFRLSIIFHSSRSQQALVKGEQRLVNLEDVVLLLPDEILNNDVELAAGAESVARAGNEVTRLIQIQLQRYSKGNGCCLGGLVVRIVADLREQLAVDIGFLCISRNPFLPLRSMSFSRVSEKPASRCASRLSTPPTAIGAAAASADSVLLSRTLIRRVRSRRRSVCAST